MKQTISLFLSTVSFFLLFPAISLLPASAQSSSDDWTGRYEFFDAQKGGPKNRPGNFITYALDISRNGDSLSARFTADGAQTSDDYECRIEPAGGSIKVIFARDRGGAESGKARPLGNGDLMFTLVKSAAGKKTRYLFRAGNYEILPLSDVPKNRIYFERKK